MAENTLAWMWWAAAGVLLVAELLTGTFYLLMIAIGLAAAGMAHVIGSSVAVQMATAAILALVLLGALQRYRVSRRRAAAAAVSTHDASGSLWRAESVDGTVDKAVTLPSDAAMPAPSQLLDIGAEVDVLTWEPGNRTRVRYRGSDWHAIGVPPPAVLAPGRYRIVGMDGIRLILRAAA